MHADALIAENVPAAQSVHKACPARPLYFPATQLVQALWPARDVVVAAHALQLPEFANAVYCPAGHATGTDEPAPAQ